MKSILTMCNPLLDLLVLISDAELAETGLRKGGMSLIDEKTLQALQKRFAGATRVPGGSGANTARGLAFLDGGANSLKVRYTGALGNDTAGDSYLALLREAGVEPACERVEDPSGISAILVTPDKERTMATWLGACRHYQGGETAKALAESSDLFHATGYLFDTPAQAKALRACAAACRGRGGLVSFDIADPFVVSLYREPMLEVLKQSVDVLFANREEASALLGRPQAKGGEAVPASALARDLHALIGGDPRLTVVVKDGKKGCSVHRVDAQVSAPGEVVQAIDSTAAGDSFAAGFLFGMLTGKDAAVCAALANRLASRMVTVLGCNYSALNRAEVLAVLSR